MKKFLFALTISVFAFSFIVAQDKTPTPDKPQKAETEKAMSAKGCCDEMKAKDCSDMKAGKGCCEMKGQKGSKTEKQTQSLEKKAAKPL